MNLQLEIFFAKIENEEILYLRKTMDLSQKSENPDQYVDSIVEGEGEKLNLVKEKCIIHSTSWRCAHCDLVALTYIVYSDYMDLMREEVKNIKLEDLSLSHGTSQKPTPIHLEEKNIVAHALRHLSLLIKDSPETYVGALTESSLVVFKKLGLALAGNIIS